MLEQAVRGVVRAKRSAHGRDRNALRLAIIPNEGHDFFAQVRIENRLDVAAMKGVCSLVVKTMPIDRIHAEKFYSSRIDKVRERADHALAFEFPLVASAGRKTKKRRAPMPVDDDAQLHAEPVRVPAMIFALHRSPSCLLRGEESMPVETAFRQLVCLQKNAF